MPILTDSTVKATIRHSDNEPIASVAATASVNRDEATGVFRPLKPVAPGDRIMVLNPSRRGRITRDVERQSRNAHGQHCGGCGCEKRQDRRKG
jgi:hypothetical protein